MITQTRRTAGGSYVARNGRCESYGSRTWYELRAADVRIVVQDGVVYKGRMYGPVLYAAETNRAALAWARKYLKGKEE